MNQFDRIWRTEFAQTHIDDNVFFYDPELDFVLVTETDSRCIIGVIDNHDYDERFIFKPNSHKALKRYEDIHYKSKMRRELYEECVEGYIISCLCGNYEPAYMSLDMHVLIWAFIDGHLECDDSLIRKGIIKYLDFCIETGITRRLMETHGKTLFPDLFSIYMDKHKTIITILKNTLQLTQLLECEENYGC